MELYHLYWFILLLPSVSGIVTQCTTSDYAGVKYTSLYHHSTNTGSESDSDDDSDEKPKPDPDPDPDPRGILLKGSTFRFRCCGVVTAWEILSTNNGNIQFQVWKPISADKNYFQEELKAQNSFKVLISSSPDKLKYNLAPNEQPIVYPDNYIGWRMVGQNVITYKTGYFESDLNYAEDYMQEVIVGDIKTWNFVQIFDRTYAIKAYLGPGTSPKLTNLPASVTVLSTAPNGFLLYSPTVSDVNKMDTFMFKATGLSSGMFNVNKSTGEVTVASNLVAGIYTLDITVADTCELTDIAVLTVNVISQPPTISNLPSFAYVHENDKDEKCLHTFAVNDPDGDAISCSLLSSLPFMVKRNSSLIDFTICLKADQNLSYNQQKVYKLQVNCTDSYNYVYEYFSVYVNENQAPVMTNLPGQITVSAKTTNSSDTVFFVTASDVDDVVLTFSMTCSSCPFMINQDGQVVSSKSLINESTTSYTLLVSVSDSHTTAGPYKLTVFIKDINSAPVFTNLPHSLYISETQATGSSIYSLSASDVDVSDVLTISMTSISPVTGETFFEFDSFGRILSLRPTAVLDFELLPDHIYNITFTCDDDKMTTWSYLTLHILDVNESPTFATGNYFLYVKEGKRGFEIGEPGFIITDQDSGDTNWAYSITGGSEAIYFSINQSSGCISYAADFDISPDKSPTSIPVNVSVTDSGGLAATTMLNITVINVPTFTNLPITMKIPEDIASGSTIFVVSTKDDEDVMLSTDTITASLFLFNASNGAVILKPSVSLNYETTKQHNLTFQAFDGTSQSEPELLTFEILNVNEAPLFSASNYYIHTTEGMAGDTLPDPQFTVTDDDVGDTLVYSISGGTDASYFSINQTTGILSYAAHYEIKPSESPKTITLHIQVADSGGLTSHVPLSLTITNVNKMPVFLNLPLTVNLKEDITSGTEIFTVSVSDPDGESSLVTMSSDITALTFFVFNATNNVVYIRPNTSIDFETERQYSLMFKVSDGLQESNSTTLTLNIINVNEKPTFSSSNYYVEVEEGKTGDQIPIPAIAVTDQDTDDKLKYTIIETNYSCFFTINESTGYLYFAVDKIRSKLGTAVLNLHIRVIDSYEAYSDATVTLNIIHVNTPPKISNLPATIDIPESIASGSWIFNIFAEDPDLDIVHYKYMFTPSLAKDVFFLQENGNVVSITLSSSVNYEARSHYEIQMSANDGKNDSEPRSLAINIQDVPEPPVFSMPSYTTSVFENAKGSLVFNGLTITDEDAGDVVTFSLVGDSANRFCINGSGYVFFDVDYDIDKSSFDNFVALTIKATDSTLLTATATLQITVDDVNDNAPVPDQLFYTLAVARSTPVGTTIMNMNVSDADSGTNSECHFTMNDSKEYFAISSTGQLTLNKSLSEVFVGSSLNFSVVISDGGFPSLSSTASITVIIKSETQNSVLAKSSTSLSSSLDKIESVSHLVALTAASAFGVIMALVNAICTRKLASKVGKIGETNLPHAKRIGNRHKATNLDEQRPKPTTPNPPLQKPKMFQVSSTSETSLPYRHEFWNANQDTFNNPLPATSRGRSEENMSRCLSSASIRSRTQYVSHNQPHSGRNTDLRSPFWDTSSFL